MQEIPEGGTMKEATYKIISREAHPEKLVIKVGGVSVGAEDLPVIIAGPCSVESKEQMLETALGVKEAGAQMLRGCVYKPRTSPYSFQGIREAGLPYLLEASQQTGLPMVSEAMTPEQALLIAGYAEIIQIGSRNGLNYDLITAAAKIATEKGKTILLKRQTGASVEETLGAAEYAAIPFYETGQQPRVIICLRGTKIGLKDERYRNNPDFKDIPELKSKTCLPIIFDPSHAGGKREAIFPLSLEALEYGADGLMIETHRDPDKALTDAVQQITPQQLKLLIDEIQRRRHNSLIKSHEGGLERRIEEKPKYRWDRGA